MHATIYQISDVPVDKENYIDETYLPEWFWNKMDYADVIDDKDAEERCICTGERPGLYFDKEKKLLTVTDKNAYFKTKYDDFKSHVAKLTDCTLDEFVKGSCDVSVYHIQMVYNDEYDIYVCDSDGVLETLDQWVRYSDGTAYIGAVLDYHY